ncbi:MAG: dipeptidase [Balneolaceae bacterium]
MSSSIHPVQTYIQRERDRFRDELFHFLRIESISTDPTKKDEILRASGFLVEKMNQAGLQNVQQMETGGHPVVYGEWIQDPSLPTVLVYGHYDVQPPDPLDEWKTPPFEPTIRENRVYARGASDDKGQSYTHLKAIESWLQTVGSLPVNVKCLFEGEEEIGSPHLVPFIRKHLEMLACDMVLISDTAMFDENQPSITYGLKGLAYMEVEVRGPNRDLHSGVYGGGVENPAHALAVIISKLKDEEGLIQIDGFYDDVEALTDEERASMARLPFDEDRYRSSLDVPKLHGEKGYTTLERTTARPTLDVNGLWSGYQGEGAKTVLPARAGAKISMRLVPNQHPDRIADLFRSYIESIAPETVHVSVRTHHGGHPVRIDPTFYGIQAAAEAFGTIYGKDILFSREGGSIPIVADFMNELNAPSVLMGFGLSKDALHSPNESFSLDDFDRGIQTSALFLEKLRAMTEERT